MNLKPGKKYLVDGTKEKIAKRDQGDKGKVNDTQFEHIYYHPRINYVQNAEEDESNAGYPKSQFSTRKPKNVEFSAFINSVTQYSHDKIPFLGANRTTYEDVKYNEVHQTIKNDELYQVSSNTQIKYHSATYNHGDILYASQGTSFETVRGNPLFVRVVESIYYTPPQSVEPTQDDYYFVYGTSEAAYLNGLKYNGTTYYPGDMFLGVDGVSHYQVYLNGAYVDFPNASQDNGQDNGGHFPYGVFNGEAVVINLKTLNNPTTNGSSTLTGSQIYVVYGYSNAFYNGYSLRPEILLRNIFKTGANTDFAWDDNTTGRKFPIIREVVKSDSIQRGIEYYIASDRKINTEESQIKYDGAFIETKTNEDESSTAAGVSFVGKNQASNYSVPSKEISVTNDTKDTESSANLSPYAENLDRHSGIPFVIKKEPIGLRKGQDYILVPGEVTSIALNVLYRVRGAGSIEYPVDSDIILYNGECFKGVVGKEEFDTTGVVSVFPVVNQITLEGAPAGTKISINGAAEIDYSGGNMALLATSYDQRGLKFKITTCTYPLLHWDTTTGFPKVYPTATSLNDNSSIHVHAAGSGSVLFPKKNLYYLCDGVGLNASGFGRKTKVEVDGDSTCSDAGGEWVPQRVAHDLATRAYYDLDSFDVFGGSCSIDLYNKDQNACEANGGTWTKDGSADVFDDQLFTYVTEVDGVGQNYPFKVTAAASATGSTTSDDPSSPPAASQIELTSLPYPLKENDCISFEKDSNDNYPLFIVGSDYEVSTNPDPIEGILLYGNVINGSVGTVGIKPSTDNTNPYEHYYVEDLEVETNGSASVGDVTVGVNAIPVGIPSGALLKFKNSSGVFSGELKLTQEAASGSTSLVGSLRAGNLVSADKAKISASEVGSLAMNSEFSHKSRFKGIPNFNVIRAYNYKALGSALADDNTQAGINAYDKIKVYDVLQTTDVLANEIAYRVGGTGYIKYNGTIYHGEARGRVVVNHEANINGELDDADSDDLENKGAYYQGSSTIRVRPLASHIPAGTEIVFPNGVFRLSKNADTRDTVVTGEILADYMENFIYSTIWHNDESFYYKVEGSSITGVGGSFTKVNKDEKTTTNDDVFVYNSAAIEWVDGEELDPISPPYYDRQIIKITGSERKEYFVEVTPTVAAKDYLVENKKYDVQADGSFVEINRQLTNGEIEEGGSFVVGGNVYDDEAGLKFDNTAEPQRKGSIPEFIIYDRKPYVPGEVFQAVEGETSWLEVTISGAPAPLSISSASDSEEDAVIWRIPINPLTAPLPLVPALRGEDDVVWTPEADLNDNELIPLFGYWDEVEKEWIDKEIFSTDGLTKEGQKIYKPLRLRFGNGAVGEVVAPTSLDSNYDLDDQFYEKGCTEIFLRNVSSKSFQEGDLGKTGSGTANSGKVFGGYIASNDVTMTIKSLPHELPAGTELVFYPSHPFRQFRALVEEQKLYEKQYPHDWWSTQSGARRFTLNYTADAGATEIRGTLEAAYNSNVSTFEGVGFKARAEIFREIIYNDRVVRAGESFTCMRDVKDLSDERESRVIKTWKDSQNSKLGIKNSTGVEEVVSYDNFIDYYEERPIFSGKSFNFQQSSGNYKFSGTSSAVSISFGDISGSQKRFSEDFGMFFFIPQFGLINKTVDSAKIYKVSKTSEKAHSHLFDNTAVLSYTQEVISSTSKIKVGGNGAGYISYGSTTKNIGEDFDSTVDVDITFKPSLPAMYQKIPTGFEANKFYLLGVEDLPSGQWWSDEGKENTHDPSTLYQKLKYNSKRYFPFINDAGFDKHEDQEGTLFNYSDLSIGEHYCIECDTPPCSDNDNDCNYDNGYWVVDKLHPPYIQSYIFGRSFAPLLENRIANNKLDKIKLLKLSENGWSHDTTIINTARYFSLINSTFIYYTILFKKKFNNQWSNWEIAERQTEATVEKLTSGQPSKIRIYDSTDISSEVQDLRYMVTTSSDSYYSANYPHLVNIIEEKYPVLVNGMEDQRLYAVEEGPVIYAQYEGTTEGVNYGFNKCNENVPVSGSHAQHKFFYGKTDAWVSNGERRLETMDHEGVFNPTDFDPATTSFGNFDEIMVKPDSASTAGSIYSVATCYDPWEIQPHRIYEVTGHANDRIEYNGRTYEPNDFITGKSLNAPNSFVAASLFRHSMTATEYEVTKRASIQPWMLSNEGVYSKEVGYKKLTPLLYKNHGSSHTLEADKRYVLHNSSSTATEGSYNAMNQMVPSNEFIGGSSASYTSTGSPVVMQKFEDGQTILPGVEYFVHGQGKITYPTEVRTSAAVSASNTPVSVTVIALTLDIEKGQVLTFDNGAEFIATSKSFTSATTITGIIRKGNIISGSASPVIVNHTSSSLAITAKGDLETVAIQTDNKNLEVEALPQDLFKGEALKFSGGGIIVLTENAYAEETTLTGNVYQKIISSGETAQITDYRELKTRQITASGNLSTGQSNTFKGLSGFSRVGGKLGAPEILTAAPSGAIKQALLYKVFKQGYVTYASKPYYGENIIYGTGVTFTVSDGNSSVREIVDPYDVSALDQVYAYGATAVDLFEYLDENEEVDYIKNDGNYTTWNANYSGLKIHKIPYNKNAGQFDTNQPTVCSSKIYGIEPGVTYTVGSSDFLSNGDERRAVVKYVKDTGSCKMRNGDPLQSSKYNKRNDCLRRDILTIDFDGNDDQQSWEDEKIEYGDYKTNGVKFRVTADFPAHYANGVILKANDVLEFSKGGRFVLSQDIDLDLLVLVEDIGGENRYYGTMYGVIPFDCFLYHHEYSAVLSWVGNVEDHYYTSDGNTFSGNATERIYVHNHQLENGVVYRVEEGVQIRYNGANYSLGDTLTGADGVDFWEYTDLSNEFEYVTRAGKTETEFVGVAGRPFVEIAEGNPKIYVKGEGPLSDGAYVIEGDDPVYYDKEYTPTSNSIINSYYDKYFDCSEHTPTSFAPKSEAYLAGPYTEGILTTEANTYFEVSNPIPLDNGSWVYDTEKLGAYVDLSSDYPKRENYANATGIAEAQDFVDAPDGSADTWGTTVNTDNNYVVAEGFLEFLHTKSSDHFPEVGANGLAYKETHESVLFDVSSDGFYTQDEVPVTGAVFGAGDFAIHHWDETADVLHETVIYKGYGNLSHAGNSTQGKSVSQGSIEEGYMYRVSYGSTSLEYKDKLIIINNDAGYSSVNMDGNQVTFDKGDNNNDNFNYDSFENDLYSLIQVERKGHAEEFVDNDVIVFESLIVSSAAAAQGAHTKNSANSAGVSISSLPVGLQEGEVLFFETSESVTSVVAEQYYCVTAGVVPYGDENYGPYYISRVFKATGSGSIDVENGSAVEVSVLTLSEPALQDTNALYGTVSQADLETGRNCYREVAIKITEAFAATDAGISGKISDPLFLITSDTALKIRSLSNGQIISKAFDSNFAEKGVYSEYLATNRFKGVQSTPSWRGSSAQVEYSNLTDHTSDFFKTVAHLLDLKGEYLSGQPKVLYKMNSSYLLDENGSFDIRYYLYDLDYGDSARGLLTIGSSTTEGKNNFFIGDGSTTDPVVIDNLLSVKDNDSKDIKSFVYVYKAVSSGDIVSGREYLVYGTGSIEYEGVTINSSLDFERVSFTGATSASYKDKAFTRKSWNRTVTNTAWQEGSSIPLNESKFYVARPVVYEKIYAGDENFSLTTEAGAIYYVFGEGSITYKSKKIYATNKYIAVASNSTTNKLIPSGDIAYGGRMIPTLGDQYNLSKNIGVVSPILPVRVWTYAAYMSAVGRQEPSLNNIADKVYLYRKIHGSEPLETNKKYFIYGPYDHVSYKIGSNDYDYYPRGVGRADVTVKGSSALTVSDTTVTVDVGANDFSTISAGSEIWITWTDASGTVHQTPRTVTNKASDTEVTIDSPIPAIGGSIQTTWSGKTDGATIGKTSAAGTFSTNTSVGVITRILLKRASIVKKGLGCCIYVRSEWLSPSNSSTVLRHKKYTYSDVFGFTSLDGNGDPLKIPRGYNYVVRGRGSVIYPVFVHASNPGTSYTLLSGESNIYKHNVLSREYESGEVFSALEHPDYIGGNTVTNSSHFYKNTGQERVYRLPKDYKRREEEINSMDQFIDMAPPKYGVKSGQLLYGYSYRVSYIDPDSGDVFSGFWWADEHGDAGITYAGKLYTVGQTFVCVSEKDGSQQLQAGDKLTTNTIKGGERVIREFSGNPNCIVRPIDGIRKCSTKGEWSNEWSMFITTTHHHPSRTSTWHHDYYGDVMGFLNNRCHIFSEDFKLSMYKHLLDTFSYGIKPVIRSEAPPGHMYLEGSNASQEWFFSEVDESQLNEWFYSSCQVYKPDYKIDDIHHIDYSNLYDEKNFNDNGGEFRIERQGVCVDCKILSKGSCLDENGDSPVDGNGDPFEDQASCVQAGHEWNPEAGKDCSKKNRKECDEAGGKWIELKDRVRVTLDRRLTHTPKTVFTGSSPAGHAHASEQESGRKISDFDNNELMDLHHAMGSGPFTPEVYRTDENSVIEYLIRERYVDDRDRPDFETPDGKLISGEPVQVQCNKAKIGDSAPDIFIWRLPDDPFGACEPRFYFTKHIPYVYDDNKEQGTMWIKTPVTIDPFVQMEMYLRGFCGGFIDKESDPQHEEITEVEDKYGEMKTLDATCYMSKDYDYLFENLSIQALDDEGPSNGSCSDSSQTNRFDCESNGACLDVSGEFSPLDEDQNPYEDQASCIQAGHVWHSTNTWKQYQNYKTIFKNIRDVEIQKERIITIERTINLPPHIVKDQLYVAGIRGWVIYRYDPDSPEHIIDRNFERKSVVKAGSVRFKYTKYCVGNCTSVDPNTRSYKYIDVGTPTVFIDRYEEKLDGNNTLSYNKLYYIIAVGKDMKTALRYSDTKRVVSSERWTTEAHMFVVEDSQSNAEISFTPSYCSDPKYKTKSSCEQFQVATTGENPVSVNTWMPAKYYTIERKRTLLPHYTEWKISDTEIAPRTESIRQYERNKKLKTEDRLPEFQFQVRDIDVSTAEDDDPVYSGVDKEYEIRIFAFYKRLGSGICSDLDWATENDCERKGGYWTPTPITTDEMVDEFERVVKIRANGLKNNPGSVNDDIDLFNSGDYYGSLLVSSNDDNLNIRFKYFKLSPPIDKNTKKPITGLEQEIIGTYTLGLTSTPIKAPKLFYEVQYRVKYAYSPDSQETSSVRREEWEVVKRYQDISNDKEITYIDTNRYENQNVSYRIMKAQSRAGGSRWMSPMMLVDELTDYPDDRKGFGPLPNIRLRAYVFNQFANAINLLNEARLDLPITIKYRYHVLGVAKPCSTNPTGGIVPFGYELNEGPPTTGAYCVGEYCRHAVLVNLAPTQDRYEKFSPGWGGTHRIIDKWTDPEGEVSVSGWFTAAGHTEFSANREYGFRQWPLMDSAIDASIALGGTRINTELKVNGEQLAFSFAVPDLLRSRTSTDSLVLSGRMDRLNIWHPTMRGVPMSYWEARDKGVDSSDWPEYCGYGDSTGFSERPFAAYGFYNMGGEEGGEGKWVIFDRKETSKSWCQDIKGTFTMKAPALKDSFGGIIISHQMSGSRHLNTCTFGGSQSSLIFTTRASTGDNNMRLEIPVKDKLGSWPICSFFAYKNTEKIVTPDPEAPEPKEDVETAQKSGEGNPVGIVISSDKGVTVIRGGGED